MTTIVYPTQSGSDSPASPDAPSVTPPLLAWYCGPGNGLTTRPLEGKARRARLSVGQTLRVEPPILACSRGLHASKRLLDALGYSRSGSPVCIYRVEVGGALDEQADKVAAETRAVLALLDASTAERELRLFACDAAQYAFEILRKRGEEPDPRSVEAVAVAMKYAVGKADKKELDAAWAAAWAAARDAARAAAWDAARDAARAAARAAAWAAAWDAAYGHLGGMLEGRILCAMGMPAPVAGGAS